MTDEKTLDQAVQSACFSADAVAMGQLASGATGAELTRAVIRRSLEALEANGIIEIRPIEDWPEYYVPDLPYKGHRLGVRA